MKLEKRKLLLNGEVETNITKELIQSIININAEDDALEKFNKNYVRVPIELYINSPGGNVYEGFALIDVIRNSKTPVYTIALGSAMSMGMLIYSVGHKRYVGEYSTLMFHDVSSAIADKLEGIEERVKELKRIQAMICTVVVNNSSVPIDKLAHKLNKREDWYISPQEAIDLKLADDYFKGF
jgi:ATP-dependent Clp protease protease subunit